MQRFLLVFLFIRLISHCSFLFGQADTTTFTVHGVYEFRYNPGELDPVNHLNLMIREIATDADKSLRNTRFADSSCLHLNVIQNGNGKKYLKIFFDRRELSGDLFYRGFNMSDVLIPDRFQTTISFLSKKDSALLFQVKTGSINIRYPDSIPLSNLSFSLHTLSDSVQLTETEFSFSDESFRNFKKKIEMINDYYESGVIIDTLLKVSGSIDLRNRSLIPYYFIRLDEINKMITIIGNRDFDSNLHLQTFDPLHLSGKYHELVTFSLSANMSLTEALDMPELIKPVFSKDSLIYLFVSGMVRYIQWSLYSSWQMGTICKEYLSTCFKIKAFEDDDAILKKLLYRIHPEINVDSAMTDLFFQVKSAYNETAGKLIVQNRYAEAVELLENQRLFIKRYPWLQEPNTNNSMNH